MSSSSDSAANEKSNIEVKARGSGVLLNLYWLVIFIIVFASRQFFYFSHPSFISSDAAVYLAMGKLLLEGAVPYRDFFDFNFPLIIYVSVIPHLMQRFMLPHSMITQVFDWFVNALFFFSVLLSVFVFRSCNNAYRGYLWPVLFALLFFHISQSQDFGQREHLFVLGYLPYFLLRTLPGSASPRIRNPILQILCGLTALSIHYKPYLPLIALAVELFVFASDKSRLKRDNLELRILIVGSLLYYLHIFFYPPEALAVLFGEAVPAYLGGFAWYHTSLLALFAGEPLLLQTSLLLIPTLLLAFPMLAGDNAKPNGFVPRTLVPDFHLQEVPRTLVTCLLIWNLLALALYVYFSTGWVYRFQPVQITIYVLLALEVNWLGHLILRGGARRLFQRVFAVCSGILSFTWFAYCARVADPVESASSDYTPVFTRIRSDSKPGDSIIVIGSGVYPGYPAILLADRKCGSRYLHAMHLPMLSLASTRAPEEARWKEILKRSIERYGSDINSHNPALIFVQEGEIANILAEFGFSKYLSAYQDEGLLGFDGLRVYRRISPVPSP